MKKIQFSIACLAMFAMIFTSCSKEETSVSDDAESNFVELKFGAVLNDFANRSMKSSHFDQIPTCSSDAPAVAVIGLTIEGVVQDDVEVAILSDSNGFFTAYSEDLKIPVPNGSTVEVTVNSFLVWNGDPDDAGSEIIWVAPVSSTEGQFAGYVENPLPFSFDLAPNTKPYIDVEVLCFDRRMVNQYGYPFFDLVPSVVYPLCFFANLCSPEGRHYVGNYSVDLFYDDGDQRIQLYDDETPVTGGNNSSSFSASPVCLVVPGAPDGFGADDPYLFYVITPLDWPANYGDVENTPWAEIGLSWNDVNGLLNDDNATNEYIHLFIGCGDNPGGGDCPATEVDRDGDCVPDNEDDCPDVPGSPANFGCPLDDCTSDTDGDGVVDCDDACPDVQGPANNNGCPEDDGGDTCETAFMAGDTPINSFANSNRWGWAENYDTTVDGSSKTFDFWAGAGQNNTANGELAGTVTISVDGAEVTFQINLNEGFSLDELHVHLSEDSPGAIAKSPGLYNRNGEVDASDLEFTLTRTSDDSSFWVIVHGVTCY